MFAAVWEDYLDAPDLEDYIKGRLSWSDLIIEMTSTNDLANEELNNIKELERIVRKYKLFNMND